MLCQWRQVSMLGAAESPLGDREGGATAIFEKSGPPDSADPADFCNKIRDKAEIAQAPLDFCKWTQTGHSMWPASDPQNPIYQ